MYRIRRAAELAGMSPELVRAWERRYGLLEPSRTDAGYRVYSEQDVRLLRGARRLVERGQSIAEVARLPREHLLQAGNAVEVLQAAAPFNDTTAPTEAPSGGREDLSPVLEEALAAISSFNQERLEAVLFRVMGLGALSPEEMCSRLLLPLLRAIGTEWEAGRMSVAAEHFGSSLIRSKILRLVDHERARPNAPVVICACPPGEEHEGALLAFAVFASRSGLRPVYLGPDTPAEAMVSAAERTNAHLIALSITSVMKAEDVVAMVGPLERWRSADPRRQLLVGGTGAQQNRRALEVAGLQVADDIGPALAALTTGPQP